MFNKHKEETVSCDGCKCLINKKDAQRVEIRVLDLFLPDEENFYCGICKKAYDKVRDSYGYRTYYRRMIVDEQGEPLGYVRKPEEKPKK